MNVARCGPVALEAADAVLEMAVGLCRAVVVRCAAQHEQFSPLDIDLDQGRLEANGKDVVEPFRWSR